jgi:hypothetical protein
MGQVMQEPKRTTRQILEDAQRNMDTAEIGYKTFVSGSPATRISGLMNLTVFGVSVTSVLQNLRHIELKFEQWYGKYRVEMISDPLMKYFWNLRSEILKEGKLKVGASAVINFFGPVDVARLPPPPPNAKVKGFFMSDNLGGSGYEIQQADGSVEKYYVNMPSDIITTRLHFPNPPRCHLGKELTDCSIEALSRLYLNYLQKMIDAAKAKFGN